MGALIGFALGYVVGVNAGPNGLAEIQKAWSEISKSDEFQGLLAAITGFAQNLLAEGGGAVATQLQSLADGQGELFERFAGNGSSKSPWLELSQSPEIRELLQGGTQILGGLLTQGSALMAGRPAAR